MKMADGEMIYVDLKNKNEFYKNVQERYIDSKIFQVINLSSLIEFK